MKTKRVLLYALFLTLWLVGIVAFGVYYHDDNWDFIKVIALASQWLITIPALYYYIDKARELTQ